MKESVGNVQLDYTYYTGDDNYSDGTIEDELLEIVRKNKEYDQIIMNDNRWPILYHLSKYRANIIEWYPFNRDSNLLEIGAGCGAITKQLTNSVKDVTCVELSKKRSLINANRNSECTHLKILVGDFNLMKFDERYDYITLIGVLEYASMISKEGNPFSDLLTKVKQLLKPGGKLIIAIENKFGLKYWAGAREDHTRGFFDSIEGYRNIDFVKTFSKFELEALLKDVGFENQKFYYPIPDYKLPFEIYSDDYLPNVGDLRGLKHNFDSDRLQLFDEESVYDSLIANKQFSFFANSFLVICE